MLSHALKLSRQHAETGDKTRELPLGIRNLISDSNIFMALIIFLVLSRGLITIKGIDITEKNAFVVLSFRAGFSEPFFILILDKVAGQAGTSFRRS